MGRITGDWRDFYIVSAFWGNQNSLAVWLYSDNGIDFLLNSACFFGIQWALLIRDIGQSSVMSDFWFYIVFDATIAMLMLKRSACLFVAVYMYANET